MLNLLMCPRSFRFDKRAMLNMGCNEWCVAKLWNRLRARWWNPCDTYISCSSFVIKFCPFDVIISVIETSQLKLMVRNIVAFFSLHLMGNLRNSVNLRKKLFRSFLVQSKMTFCAMLLLVCAFFIYFISRFIYIYIA